MLARNYSADHDPDILFTHGLHRLIMQLASLGDP
jgi:hypothetical protein